ncbi:KilA-N domain-containing protein [Paraburkholderia sp. MM5384-R2]|uniref:KilA-N domain-containing protein n=1 Tax=Paraburkholderia sp. MM5384-R2 TaxID=2723097 RepID=UPI00161CFE33|nr:KilA-N domain-containing protein [Paraburkholderia sp. MM5384-R2]MBB5501546.1 hypothetical protein [Paraburkholderia sp. MM5384-R2]
MDEKKATPKRSSQKTTEVRTKVNTVQTDAPGGARVIVADFDGWAVAFDSSGWFNATYAAKRYSKRPTDWLRLSSTVEYMRVLREVLGISEEIPLIRAVRNSGTWLCPELAVSFARWLNTRFAVWCDATINRILRGGATAWNKPPEARSETPDREGLLSIVAAIVARHGLLFNTVYESLNLYVGVNHARQMTCAQVADAAAFGERLLAGNATPEDFARIERHRLRLGGMPAQLSLGGTELTGGDA